MSEHLQGIYEDMPNSAYHKSEGVSKSGLDKIDRSPAHYKWPKKFNTTRSMEIGTAIHAAILEPVRFAEEYVIVDCNARTHKDYKQAVKDCKHPNASELTLTKPESENVLGMQESIHSNAEAMQFLSAPGKAELSMFATDPETGVQIRCRFDWLTDDGYSVDVKKTQDLRKFGKSVHQYRYHVQDAMYRHVYKLATGDDLKEFLFLAVEEQSPHSNHIFLLDEEAVEIGEFYYRKNLIEYAECINSGKWPHQPIDSIIQLPYYAAKNYEYDKLTNDMEGFQV